MPVGRAMMQKFTNMKKPRNHPLYKYLSPTPFINEKANNVLVVNGMIDVMTIFQSKWMVEYLEKAGVPHDFYEGRAFPNSFHDFMLLSRTKESKKCMKYTADWLNAKVLEK